MRLVLLADSPGWAELLREHLGALGSPSPLITAPSWDAASNLFDDHASGLLLATPQRMPEAGQCPLPMVKPLLRQASISNSKWRPSVTGSTARWTRNICSGITCPLCSKSAYLNSVINLRQGLMGLDAVNLRLFPDENNRDPRYRTTCSKDARSLSWSRQPNEHA